MRILQRLNVRQDDVVVSCDMLEDHGQSALAHILRTYNFGYQDVCHIDKNLWIALGRPREDGIPYQKFAESLTNLMDQNNYHRQIEASLTLRYIERFPQSIFVFRKNSN